jgi:stalled ribosome rescue protein Dom34
MLRIEKNRIIAKIESEEELFLIGLLIEPKDFVEMKIVRNVFSFSNGKKKKIDRIETFAKIFVEKIKYLKEINCLRLKGKIIETEKEVTKGYHGENIKVGSEIIIEKEKIEEIFIERKNLLKVKNIGKEILKNEKIVLENVEESIEYGLIEFLIICYELFFEKKELIKKCFEKRTKVIITKDKEFCEKIKIVGLRRF